MAPIHPALFLLTWLRLVGGLRQVGRKVKTVKGALLFAFGLLIFLNWMPMWAIWTFGPHRSDLVSPHSHVRLDRRRAGAVVG